MTDLRQIALCHDYQALVAAFRARAAELEVSRATLDDVSGLQSGYCAKLLADPPVRRIGAESLGPLLGALGLAIIVVEDPEQLRRVASRLEKRNAMQVRSVPAIVGKRVATWLFNTKKARKAGKSRMAQMTPEQRSALGRKGGRARWRAVREARRAARNAPATSHPQAPAAAGS